MLENQASVEKDTQQFIIWCLCARDLCLFAYYNSVSFFSYEQHDKILTCQLFVSFTVFFANVGIFLQTNYNQLRVKFSRTLDDTDKKIEIKNC